VSVLHYLCTSDTNGAPPYVYGFYRCSYNFTWFSKFFYNDLNENYHEEFEKSKKLEKWARNGLQPNHLAPDFGDPKLYPKNFNLYRFRPILSDIFLIFYLSYIKMFLINIFY